jgi:hypothetical protein
MGEDPTQKIWGMMGDKAKGQFGGDPDAMKKGAQPQGQLVAMLEPVKKVLQQMVKMNDRMQPFVQRALAILDAGMASAVQAPAGSQGMAGGRDNPPMSAKPPEGEGAKSFPGM